MSEDEIICKLEGLFVAIFDQPNGSAGSNLENTMIDIYRDIEENQYISKESKETILQKIEYTMPSIFVDTPMTKNLRGRYLYDSADTPSIGWDNFSFDEDSYSYVTFSSYSTDHEDQMATAVAIKVFSDDPSFELSTDSYEFFADLLNEASEDTY